MIRKWKCTEWAGTRFTEGKVYEENESGMIRDEYGEEWPLSRMASRFVPAEEEKAEGWVPVVGETVEILPFLLRCGGEPEHKKWFGQCKKILFVDERTWDDSVVFLEDTGAYKSESGIWCGPFFRESNLRPVAPKHEERQEPSSYQVVEEAIKSAKDPDNRWSPHHDGTCKACGGHKDLSVASVCLTCFTPPADPNSREERLKAMGQAEDLAHRTRLAIDAGAYFKFSRE